MELYIGKELSEDVVDKFEDDIDFIYIVKIIHIKV